MSEISLLQRRVEVLESTVALLSTILKTIGYPIALWITPAQAATICRLSPNQVRSFITTAETNRIQGKPTVLQYGKHYRNVAGENSSLPTWQVNLELFQDYLSIPPEQR